MGNDVDPIILEAIEAAGGTAILAQRIGIQAPSIYSWRRVPAERVLAVETATGISRHKLRPDIYPPPSPKARSRRPRRGVTPPESATPPLPEPQEAAD